MIDTKIFEFAKRTTIILLIMLFSVSGIVACGGVEEIAGSRGGIYTKKHDGTGPVNQTNSKNQTEQTTFDENTYYTIYAPFVNWEDKSKVPSKDKIIVSWQDSNTLTQIWKKQIEGGKYNDGERWFIRDANNNQKAPLTGSYYYFDKDFNIVYYRQGKGSLTVRKFRCGTIINYSNYCGIKPTGETCGIGGVYETILTKKEITDNNFDQLNIFMGHEDMGKDRGNLEILTMNTGYAFDNNSEFGVDFYYNKGVKNVEEYTSENISVGVRNLSWKPEYVNFKFFSAKPQEWHLTDHLVKQGWHE